MTTARDIAPEVDRLVLAVNRRVGPKHGARLRELAKERNLDSIYMLPHFEDFLFTRTLSRELATLRLRYRSPEDVNARIDELEAKGLIASGPSGYGATPALQPLLEELLAARADIAAALWRGHEAETATITAIGRTVADAATLNHAVAVAHRSLPDPDNPYLRTEHRLFTLRYIRQHDHAEAWLARGLTASQIVALTALWHGDDIPAGDGPEWGELASLGYVDGDPPRLTAAGREVRDAIEADTNDRNQRGFDVLGDSTAAALLAALRRLPGTVP